MRLKIGNRTIFDCAIRDKDGILVSNLATATAVKFMVKENATDLDNAAIIYKSLPGTSLPGGIQVNTPSTGYIRITVLPADTASATPGEKYVALQIEYATDNKFEVDLKDGNLETNKIFIDQDIIR